jgi:hypothetical protein
MKDKTLTMQWCGWDAYIWQVVLLQINVLAHLPNLHDVVFGNAGHHPATTRQTRSPREALKARNAYAPGKQKTRSSKTNQGSLGFQLKSETLAV